MAICDNLKKKPAQTQIALDNLGGAFNEKFIFPINKVVCFMFPRLDLTGIARLFIQRIARIHSYSLSSQSFD